MSRTRDIPVFLPSETIQATYTVNSGVTLSTPFASILDDTDTIVSSVTLSQSGSGVGTYYANVTLPSSEAYYVMYTNANINSQPYPRKIRFKVADTEV